MATAEGGHTDGQQERKRGRRRREAIKALRRGRRWVSRVSCLADALPVTALPRLAASYLSLLFPRPFPPNGAIDEGANRFLTRPQGGLILGVLGTRSGGFEDRLDPFSVADTEYDDGAGDGS